MRILLADWVTSLSFFTFMHWRRKWQPTPVFLPGESLGQRSLLGYHLWGRRVGHDWHDLASKQASQIQPFLDHYQWQEVCNVARQPKLLCKGLFKSQSPRILHVLYTQKVMTFFPLQTPLCSKSTSIETQMQNFASKQLSTCAIRLDFELSHQHDASASFFQSNVWSICLKMQALESDCYVKILPLPLTGSWHWLSDLMSLIFSFPIYGNDTCLVRIICYEN